MVRVKSDKMDDLLRNAGLTREKFAKLKEKHYSQTLFKGISGGASKRPADDVKANNDNSNIDNITTNTKEEVK